MAMSAADLDSFAERIQRAYDELGHRLGWRFLYTPAATFSSDTKLALIALNPGGDRYHEPAVTVEEGNAYRLEEWGDSGGPNPLQVQVYGLFRELAQALDEPSVPALMDATLTANFCPFRAPSWKDLPNRAASVRFSKDLWHSTLQQVAPRVLICLGNDATKYVTETLEAHGARPGRAKSGSIGWGPYTYGLHPYQAEPGGTLVVRLPHLSRFAIFGRPASAPAVRRLMKAISAST
jgi:hypothetical protein